MSVREKNLHLLEFVRTASGKKITLNRIIRDENWFKELNEILEKYNGVYVRANHNTRVIDGKALTCSDIWVPVRTRTKTSIKVSVLQDFGNGRARRVFLGTKELADAMMKKLSLYQSSCIRVNDTTIEIPYRWSVLSDWEIRKIYSETRIFF